MATLVIEDGSIVTGANSYISVEEARTYASCRGVSLSEDDSVVEVQLIKANDYLQSLRCSYKGCKTNYGVLNETEYLKVLGENMLVFGEPVVLFPEDIVNEEDEIYGYKKQYLEWPRSDVYLDDCSDVVLDQNEIPQELKDGQAQLVVEQFNGVDIMPTSTGKFVIDERVGPLVTKYSEKMGYDGKVSMSSVDSVLAPLLKNTGFGSVRI